MNRIKLCFHKQLGHEFNIADAECRCVVCGMPESEMPRFFFGSVFTLPTYTFKPEKAITLSDLAKSSNEYEINQLIKKKKYQSDGGL